jgi:uncharacterized protein YndB with AHSA1/START domain
MSFMIPPARDVVAGSIQRRSPRLLAQMQQAVAECCAMKTLRFESVINASREKVWRTMLEQDTYRIWTAEFSAGSYYEGSWEEGARIRFLAPDGGGMTAVIDENREYEHISIRHLGEVRNGVDDTESDLVKSWAGNAFERYTLREQDGATHLEVTCDVTPEYESMMSEMWPRALSRLKTLVETGS